MKKKFIIVILLLFVVISTILIIFFKKRDFKFRLDEKYYNNSKMLEVNAKELNDKIINKESFVLFSYNNYCMFSVPCNDIFENVLKDVNISSLKITFEEFQKSKLYKKVKYGPSFIIVHNGKIVDYLDPNSDDDHMKYQDIKEFKKWLLKYINL